MIKWYQVFTYWLILSINLKVFNLFILSLIATVGQLYIMTYRGPVNPLFLFFRIILHIIPMVYVSHESNPVHMLGLVAAYTGSLALQGTNPIKIYKEIILEEPTDMTITQFVQTRFF
jgi:hypothetical protein